MKEVVGPWIETETDRKRQKDAEGQTERYRDDGHKRKRDMER